jgi:hypothetical protein
VFRLNQNEAQGRAGVTHFGGALSSLNLDIVCANTLAAKGRVERAHRTLQDRLVKELPLREIRDVAAANAFSPCSRPMTWPVSSVSKKSASSRRTRP